MKKDGPTALLLAYMFACIESMNTMFVLRDLKDTPVFPVE